MEKRDVVVFQVTFKDPKYAPDAEGMNYILRLVNGVIKDGGGALVLPDKMDAAWLKERWNDEVNKVKTKTSEEDFTVLFKILHALDVVTAERVSIQIDENAEAVDMKIAQQKADKAAVGQAEKYKQDLEDIRKKRLKETENSD